MKIEQQSLCERVASTSEAVLDSHKKLHARVAALEQQQPDWRQSIGCSDLEPQASALNEKIGDFFEAVHEASGPSTFLQHATSFCGFLVSSTPSLGFTAAEVRRAGREFRGEVTGWRDRARREQEQPLYCTFDEAVQGLPEQGLEPIPESTMAGLKTHASWSGSRGLNLARHARATRGLKQAYSNARPISGPTPFKAPPYPTRYLISRTTTPVSIRLRISSK